MGLAFTVLMPERMPGGVRLTIALANPTAMPMDVDTAQMGKPALQFNGYARAPYTVPVNKHLAPGEGYTFPCTAPLPALMPDN